MGRVDDPHFEGRLLMLVADFITVLLLTAGGALAFLSGYKLDVDRGAALAFCVFASAASVLLHSLSRPWWSIASAALIALIFWITWEETAPVLQWIVEKMNLLPGFYIGWNSRWEENLLPVLLLLTAALAWVMGWMAVRVRRWYLAAMLSFILVLPAIQMGVLPSWGAMLAAFAGWGSMLLVSLFRQEDPGSLGRAQLLSLNGMGALILALVMTLPMEGYLRPQWATDARNNLILGVRRRMERHFDMEALENGILADLGLDLSIPGEGGGGTGSSAIASGGLTGNREDLLAVGPRRYTGQAVLSARTNQPDVGRVYLRGGALGVYTGSSWEELDVEDSSFFSPESQETWMQPALFPAQTAVEAGDIYTMTIRGMAYRGVNCYPYRLAGGIRPITGGGWTDEAGLLHFSERRGWQDGVLMLRADRYEVDYVPGGPMDGFTPLSGDSAAGESLYRDSIVYEHYLDVYSEARRALEPLLDEVRQLGRDGSVVPGDPSAPPEFYDALAAASRTAEALSRRMVYDLDTPAMGAEEDFVTHFVEEGRGYCVHFATAGALLLRMQGIPARYVTGYAAQLDGEGESRVLDSDAHAWVEIYLDGYGWYPVDMTPGYAGGETGVELTDAPGAEEPDLPEEPEPEPAPEEETPEEETPEQDLPPEEAELPGEAPELPGEEPEEASVSRLPRALAGLGVTLLALCLLYALALLLRQREKTSPDVNRSVISAYRRYERLLGWGGVENEELEALGRKARFSQHTLTEEERTSAWTCLEEAGRAAEKRRKKRWRWLFSLLRPIL